MPGYKDVIVVEEIEGTEADLGWLLLDLYDEWENPLEEHLLPYNDIRDHVVSERCWCNPQDDPLNFNTCWVHNSADGREAYESGHREPH